MQRNTAKTVLGSLFCAAMLAATSGAYAADKAKAAPGDGNPNMNSTTQAIWDNPDLTTEERCAYVGRVHRSGKGTLGLDVQEPSGL